MKKITSQPIFWVGTAVIVFAFYSANNPQTQSGVETGVVIVSLGLGAAAIIYSLRAAP
jgi:hypothetical protein